MLRPLALLAVLHFEVMPSCGGSVVPVSDPAGTALAAGNVSSCRLENGVARCFGANALGQLGTGMVGAAEPTAKAVQLEASVAQLTFGSDVGCARTTDGRVYCWGNNDNRVLSLDGGSSPVPVEIALPVPAAQLSMRESTALVLGKDGRLYGWGSDAEGMLGRGADVDRPDDAPQVLRAAFDFRFTSISAGQGHACGIDTEKTLWCWGRNSDRNLGVPSLDGEQYRTPQRVMGEVQQVAAGAFTTCVVKTDASLWCWGWLVLDQPGEQLRFDAPTRMSVPPIRFVDGYWFHFCAIDTSDALHCWGRGIEGQLGSGMTQAERAPRQVAMGVSQVSTGWFSTCARDSSGVVACTGMNESGQLGLGDLRRRSSLTALP